LFQTGRDVALAGEPGAAGRRRGIGVAAGSQL